MCHLVLSFCDICECGPMIFSGGQTPLKAAVTPAELDDHGCGIPADQKRSPSSDSSELLLPVFVQTTCRAAAAPAEASCTGHRQVPLPITRVHLQIEGVFLLPVGVQNPCRAAAAPAEAFCSGHRQVPLPKTQVHLHIDSVLLLPVGVQTPCRAATTSAAASDQGCAYIPAARE